MNGLFMSSRFVKFIGPSSNLNVRFISGAFESAEEVLQMGFTISFILRGDWHDFCPLSTLNVTRLRNFTMSSALLVSLSMFRDSPHKAGL